MAQQNLENDWPAITAILVWKFARGETVITRKHLADLPHDRVLLCYAKGAALEFEWVTERQATLRARAEKAAAGGRRVVGLEALEGRYAKWAAVLLWRFCRDGCTLMMRDKRDLPADKILLTRGFRQHIEMRFVPRGEAGRIQKWERDNEGKDVLEVIR